MDRAVVAVTVCMRKACVITCVLSSDIFLANVRDQVSPLASGAIPCASKDRDRSTEGMGISCIALFALFFGVDVEKPFNRTLDLLQIRIRQVSNHTLEFMMLYGLHALHINVARLVQKLRLFALKEVRVGPCSFQKNLIFHRFVDQNPVRFNVAVASPDPIPPELVVAILWRQCFLCKEEVDNSFYFSEVFASLLHAFDILLKLLCLSEIYSSHEA